MIYQVAFFEPMMKPFTMKAGFRYWETFLLVWSFNSILWRIAPDGYTRQDNRLSC
jgi:hypothetical protein